LWSSVLQRCEREWAVEKPKTERSGLFQARSYSKSGALDQRLAAEVVRITIGELLEGVLFELFAFPMFRAGFLRRCSSSPGAVSSSLRATHGTERPRYGSGPRPG